MAKREMFEKGIVRLDGTTLGMLTDEALGVNNTVDANYVCLTVPEDSEAEKKVIENFGRLLKYRSTENGFTQLFFPCVYRKSILDIDLFASVTSNYVWGDDIVFSLEEEIEL